MPEPTFRPGDTPDFSSIEVPAAGAAPRPDVAAARGRDASRSHSRWSACSTRRARRSGRGTRKLDPDTLRKMLRDMETVRVFDDRMYRAQRQGKTSFYMKCTGEEAIAVAAAAALDRDDMHFPTYRQQGLLVARGYPLVDDDEPDLFEQGRQAEGPPAADHVFGQGARLLLDLGQSRHPISRRRSAGRWPRAIKGDSRIAMGWIGDGATAEGDFHSALTFAAVYQAPVILDVVNNQWAISSFSGFAGAERATFAARAVGYGIAGLRVDGNDALAVYAAMRWAAERARTNQGPTLIEFFTYRAEGHSTSDDPTGYRPAGEAKAWPLGDPIERLKAHLIALGEWDEERHAALDKEIDADGPRRAEGSREARHPAEQGFDNIGSMFEDVFDDMPWHLAEQREQALDEAANPGRRRWPTR